MQLPEGKKIYFLSDFHLGTPDWERSLVREKKVVQFLEQARKDAAMILVVGDMFDFWFEYKDVVPKGYVRLLGKLAEITDAGIPVHFFIGNHDMWMRGYLERELNIPVYDQPQTYHWDGKQFYIGHGDGLGPGDHGYKFLKKIFRNRICQTLFGALHPWLGTGIANYFSRASRAKTGSEDAIWLGNEKEWLVVYSNEVLDKEYFDYFIFGHRHYPVDILLKNGKSRYINLGDWITNFTYVVFDGNSLQLKKFEGDILTDKTMA
ncbi:MAG: UDP-2,3-diacylglucosamine diphosphatase [Chitinophagaceae bacterium]